jgi:hypothetical protein
VTLYVIRYTHAGTVGPVYVAGMPIVPGHRRPSPVADPEKARKFSMPSDAICFLDSYPLKAAADVDVVPFDPAIGSREQMASLPTPVGANGHAASHDH